MPIGDTVDRIFQLKARKSELQSEITAINGELDKLVFEALQDMEKEGINQVKSPLGTATRKIDLYPNVVDKDSFLKWCVEMNRPDMAVVNANSASFKAYYEENHEYPDGIDAFDKSTLKTLKARGGAK